MMKPGAGLSKRVGAVMQDMGRSGEEAAGATEYDARKGYLAVDGSWIEIPPVLPFGEGEEAALLAAGLSFAQILRAARLGEDLSTPLGRALAAPGADLRRLEALAIAAARKAGEEAWPGHLLAMALRERSWPFSRGGYAGRTENVPRAALWPLIAAHPRMIEAGLRGESSGWGHLSQASVLRALQLLPATPRRFFALLTEMALSADLVVQSRARRLLAAAPEVAPRLAAVFEDPRPELRLRALKWAAERPDPLFIEPLRRLLERENGPHLRAAAVALLTRLGAEDPDWFAPEALAREAEAGLRRAGAAALPAWLPPEALEGLRWRDGGPAPGAVALWWVRLALRRGAPGGEAAFGLRLAQLHPEDAARMGRRILEGWLGETERRDETRYMMRSWPPVRAAEINDALAHRGLLALARCAPEVWAAERTRDFLKTHGKRVGACMALLQLLASMGGGAALQTLLEARGHRKHAVRSLAARLAEEIARARGWTPEQVEDRAVSDAGLDAEGRLDLPCGAGKAYLARLDENLTLALFNPAGFRVKSLPKSAEASRACFLEARRDLASTLKIQSARLRLAMQAGRIWTPEDWRAAFLGHPFLRKMAERLVWLGLDEKGAVLGGFRPTPEGEFLDATESPVDPARFAAIRLGGASLVGEATAALWAAHLRDYEIASPFPQFGLSGAQA